MSLRDNNIGNLQATLFDVLVIGAGINGAASAAALSSTGLNVALIDQGDFACETSMNSSNLVWGGIKYMENNEFKLVYDLCHGRNELMKAYPSEIKEMRFLTNIERGFRHSRLYLYAGTWLYWLFGRVKTKIPKLISKQKLKKLEPSILLENSSGAFEYSDAYLFDNDSRFVFGFVKKAIENNATVANYVRCEKAEFDQSKSQWLIQAKDIESNQALMIQAKSIVNATGPYLDGLNDKNNIDAKHQHILSKGIHVIVEKLTPSHKVLTFFADDGRMFFAIPMGENHTSIGTTDTRVETAKPGIQQEDIDFVLDNINKRLNPSYRIGHDDIISLRYGVRPLVVEKKQVENNGDFLSLSRKHILDVDDEKKYISVFGGKLTDCVNIGNEVIEALSKLAITGHQKNSHWFGEPSQNIRQQYFNKVKELEDNVLNDKQVHRLWRRYGKSAIAMIEQILQNIDLAKTVIADADLLFVEVDYIKQNEMVLYLEDYLRRRSKLGLTYPHKKLIQDEGLKRLCELLFEENAEQQYNNYINSKPEYIL